MRLPNLAVGVILAFAVSSDAFQTAPHQTAKSGLMAAESRRFFIQTVTATFVGTVALPSIAHADVTAKLASSSALRSVKVVQKRLVGMETEVQANQYAEIKEAFRVAPFSDLRKSAYTLVKGGEDGPNAEELALKYKTFITQFEKFDATATLGMRGKKFRQGEFEKSHQATVQALAEFIDLAQQSAEIPVKYSES